MVTQNRWGWLMLVSAVGFFLPSAGPSQTQAEDGLPLVEERVDELVILHGDPDRVLFLRGGRVLAVRQANDDMILRVCGEDFQLDWQDYWTAHRIVTAKRLSVWDGELEERDDGPWWCMRRNMRDLKQP